MHIPKELKYTKEHEWVQIQNNKIAFVGITDYAQDQLGEIVFVELPEEGEEFSAGETIGVVESVKSVSDIFCPVTGRVLEVNDPLTDTPELVNDDPYNEGWLVKLEILETDELQDLMSADEYEAYVQEEA